MAQLDYSSRTPPSLSKERASPVYAVIPGRQEVLNAGQEQALSVGMVRDPFQGEGVLALELNRTQRIGHSNRRLPERKGRSGEHKCIREAAWRDGGCH